MRTPKLITAVWIAAGILSGSDGIPNRESLHGIEEIEVVVDKISPELGRYGLSEPNLKTQVELRLRSHGIRVVENARVGFLSVELNSMKHDESTLFSYVVNVAFRQPVITADQPGRVARVWAETWSSGSFGYVGSGRAHTLRDSILEKVDRFINAYLSVNPRK